MQTDRRRGGREMVLLVALSFSVPPGIFAENQPPAAVSVTPSSGSGSSQTFSFLYSDPNGFADLLWAQMAINATLNGVGACYTHYVRGTNALYLAADNGTTWLGPVTPGIAGTLQNSQCIVNAGGSSTSGTTTNLTVTLALTFKAAFNGAKNIYLRTQDAGGLASGWQQRGTWTASNVAPAAPAAVSVTPSSGSGSSQTFSFLYSDPNGFANLAWAQMAINATLNGVGACYTHYLKGTNALYLAADNGTTWLGPVTPGIAGTLQNSQCIVNAGGSSSSGTGTNLTVNLALTFKPAFNGAKNIYLRTQDVGGLASGWQTRGTWTVASGLAPLTITTVSPLASGNQGVAYSQTLEATGGTTPYTWSVGAGRPPGLNLSSSGVLSGTPTTVGTYIFTIQVSGGGTDTRVFSLTVGGPANLAPTAVSVTPSSGSGSSQTFAFLYSDPNGFADLPWAQMLFHVSLSSPVDSCYVHYDRPSNAVWLLNDEGTVWLGPVTLGIAGAVENSQCIVAAGDSSSSRVGTNLTVNLALTFQPAFAGVKNIYLQAQDAGGLVTGWQQRGTWTVGSGPAPLTITTVSPLPSGNQGVFYSQTLEATGGTTPYTWSVGAGLPPGLSLSSSGVLSGTPTTVGTYNFTVQVSGGGTDTKAFSLTIGGPASVAPTAVSVTPSSGSGSSQTFAFLYSDPNGFADLPWAQMVFSVSLSSPVNTCYVHYNRPANLMWLLNDVGTTWLGPVRPGVVSAVENSQCIVTAGDSSFSGVGTNLTVNLALTFKPAFAGAKNTYLRTQDAGGLATGWQQRGTWTVTGP